MQTGSSTRHAGVTVPVIFGTDKTLIPQVKPEHQGKARSNLNIPTKISEQVPHNHKRHLKNLLLDI